jgi:hypothetical protein
VTEIKSSASQAANDPRPEHAPQVGFAPADREGQPELEHEAAADTAEEIFGTHALPGLERGELLVAGKRRRRPMTIDPQVLIQETLAFARDRRFGRTHGRRAVTTAASCRPS